MYTMIGYSILCFVMSTYAAHNDEIERAYYVQKLNFAYAGWWKDLWQLSREYKEYTVVQACRNGDWDKVEAMVKKHHQIMYLDMADMSGKFPLWYAVQSKRYDMIFFLIAHGANPNRSLEPSCQDIHALWHTGDTALFEAAYQSDVEAALILLSYGADSNRHNKAGITPLMAAVLVNNVPIAKLLRRRGASPNVQEKKFCIVDCEPHSVVGGDTPLIVAVRRGSIDMIQQLIAGGANNVNAKNAAQQTAFSIAQMHKDNRIFNLLKQVECQEYDEPDIQEISFVRPGMWID